MGYLNDKEVWERVPYFAEDAVLTGGPDCPDNIPIQALTNRTAVLKKRLDDAVAGALAVEYANRMSVARKIAITGDASWSAKFDGGGDVSAALVLADTGIEAGAYAVVTVDKKGRVTAGRALLSSDIPGLDWSKITSGTPKTLAGYGITVETGDVRGLPALLSNAAPSGLIGFFVNQQPPDGWLRANGAEVSRATYAALFAAVGTTFGAGDGKTTFNVPDLRGEFIRGWSGTRPVDSGREFGSWQDQALQHHAHNYYTVSNGEGGIPTATPTAASKAMGLAATTETGGAETRPRNIALLACIKI